ncbi:Tyrosine-protein phosphatase non-receptor type 5,Tyrosine-protein phosphatase non-receptor type 20,Receptor-type tyrosine-protein phosphatase R,Receptor-type tyrosine-protein phosphatase eta,Tyrosine-protein phosphatase non-receptor type 7,Receptor-type tyrosine-protein phosphatase O,Receptor-type tyrosine-protein phosphatase beta [Mytilus coruscus]|uniref:protein-tyrosine-phosphatase n=1 Tax=Mytilus coruscus TaxID=42192 RepID=A0A6J8B083_MYTCO|nr:Tyrosine-protein phosphatase non-receptor type 5,Tyrosine-protein phosphatase non-receptor type 20,Receptor-type tyrosine-protein phosphatase R,Receptor-type tyrosine-protein phosphatase eta,Tyrosine-protein phosphatase non-receptor type 7,Receptor-type tyrosine-protein phosphatase O,Receptor-type tyrosine-protein phosphatase beta [Mytilus coruscus]
MKSTSGTSFHKIPTEGFRKHTMCLLNFEISFAWTGFIRCATMLYELFIYVAVVKTVSAQRNLTPFGEATQSSIYDIAGPQNAINPPISNKWGYTRCTHTQPDMSPSWWMFNISYGSAFITDIKIYYRNQFGKRMDGFQLYVSNTSTIPPPDYNLCYKDDPGLPYPDKIKTISCNQLGQYVIYYDDVPGPDESGSVIELCFVVINGCQKNFWGINCIMSCTERCIEQHCYPENGSCVLGCNSENCLKDVCDKNTAVCTSGCKERRTGSYCNKYNLAYDSVISQIPSGIEPANVNDGDQTSCSKTKGTNVRFQVDMNEIRIVTDIYLTVKGDGLVHAIYASNYSDDPENGTVLYQGGTLPRNISFNSAFRYLIYIPSIKSALVELEICEIGIVACSSGFYGSECLQNCSINCLISSCYHTTGECIGGCNSGWMGFNCTQVKSKLQAELNGAAIGGSIGAVMAVILIMLAGFVIYKRNLKSTKDKYLDKSKSSLKTNYNSKRDTNDGNEYVNAAITSDQGEVTVYLKDTEQAELPSESDDIVYKNLPTERSIYKIAIGNLKEVINEKMKNEGFKKEYEILPKGLVHAHVEGSKEENKVKNRFFTTWPYDHSRIVLKGNTRTDYINASYIDSYDKEKAYIASQGPKSNTKRDFWHMVWQENVGKIVMVTQLKEGKRDKCAQYWPDAVNEPMVVDNYRLTVTKEKEHTLYVHRLITISNNTDTKQKERKVHHFHFIQWPDHGVPDSIKLVHFYRKVISEHCDQNGPMVVHCSAGVGRTGTFIAIDALYEHGKKVDYVDIMEYVQMMRKDRMNMIQTHEQYETVFEALLELFTIPETTIPKKDFCKYIDDQECRTLPINQKLYKREFQTNSSPAKTLENLRPLYTASSFTAGNLKENISKNLVKNILPHDKFRPYLMSYGRTRTDYINAVIIPGYREESRFIVTQCPMKDTVVDFWTMIYDHNSRIIVLLDQVNKNAKLWLRRSEMLVVDDFSILQEEKHNVDELEIALSYKKQPDKRNINVFTTSDWQGATLPSTKLMVDLLKSVVNCWNSQKCPITVVCRDGCTKSGLFVALYLILDKMEIDEEVDIFQVVRNIQTRRPEFLKNCDQYEFCYKCIKELLEEESMYANI